MGLARLVRFAVISRLIVPQVGILNIVTGVPPFSPLQLSFSKNHYFRMTEDP